MLSHSSVQLVPLSGGLIRTLEVSSDPQQIPLCCPCGSTALYRRGLCEFCYNRGRRSRARFGGGRERVLAQAQRLLAEPDPGTPKGLRDRVLLGLLVGCGLRRGELAGLEFPDVSQREGRWAIVDLLGKHGRVRTVPMPSWAKTALDGWASAAGIESGAVLRRVDKGSKNPEIHTGSRNAISNGQWSPRLLFPGARLP